MQMRSFGFMALGAVLYLVTLGRVALERRSMRRRGVPVSGPPMWALLAVGLVLAVIFATYFFVQ